MSINKSLIVAIFCLVGSCVIAVLLKVFSLENLPSSFVGAALGAIITGVVTVILLDGQSRAEEVKERNVKVFEKKSEVFQKYIGVVWEVWKDHKISIDEFNRLHDLYYRELMLYMAKESTRKVGEQLKKISPLVEKEPWSKSEEDILQKALIDIVNTLSSEISLGGEIDTDLFVVLEKGREDAEERNRRKNRNFKTLGIPVGTELALRTNPDIKCKTSDEKNKVEYDGKIYSSLSNLAVELLGRSASGFAEFTLNGKVLQEIG